MCFDLDSSPPIPPISGAAVSHDDLVLEAGDGNRFAAFARDARGAGARRRRDPPRRPRPLPLLRGARAALRRAWVRGARVRLLRTDRGRREARRRLRVHAARRSRRPRTASRPTWPPRSRTSRRRVRGGLHGRLLLRRAQLVARRGVGHGLAGAIGFYGRPGPGSDGSPGPIQRAAEMAAPILALQGGDDPGIPVEDSRPSTRRSPKRASSTRS